MANNFEYYVDVGYWDQGYADIIKINGKPKIPASIFLPPRTLSDAGNVLSAHMPDGRAFGKKCEDGSVMNGLVRGIASDFYEVQKKVYELAIQFDIDFSTELLSDWELSVGIPDDCIFDLETLEERRASVISRLRKVPVVTAEDFEQLALDLSGLEITVTPGVGVDGNRFHMYVNFGAVSAGFPYTFDFPFSSTARFDVIKCVFARVKPANIIIFYT